MKTIGFVIVTVTLFVLASCESAKGKNKSVHDYADQVEELEAKIKDNQVNQKPVTEVLYDSLVGNLLEIYHQYPKDPMAPKALDKIQMLYSGLGKIQLAVKYADTLIENYPTYPNLLLIIESQAANYDIFVNPRDTNKVKHYFNLLLKEDKQMDPNKKKDIELRLQNLKLTFDEFVAWKNKKSVLKIR